MLKANLSSAPRLKSWLMLEMCLVKDLFSSSLGSLLHVPAMLLFKCQWGRCNEPKGCVQTWDSEHYPVDPPSKISSHLC